MIDIILFLLIGVLFACVIYIRNGVRGPKGDKGEIGAFLIPGEWEIKPVLLELLDDPEYITKLIKKINSLQISKGDKINED